MYFFLVNRYIDILYMHKKITIHLYKYILITIKMYVYL